MSDTHSWDTGKWSRVNQVTFDFMTYYIMEHLTSTVSFEDKTVLELGAGTGRLSCLALQHGARKVTLVDSSSKAISLAKGVFNDVASGLYDIIQDDILEYESGFLFDIVMSSGVVEHFQGENRFGIIERHVNQALGGVLIIHPTSTFYSSFFNNFYLSKRLYGFQKSFTDREMDSYLARLPRVASSTHERFHPFYTVPLLHNNAVLNRWLDAHKFGHSNGGLTLTAISVGSK